MAIKIDDGNNARAAEVVVTLEDHVLLGGYGSAVLELLSEKRIHTPVVRIGWPDQFIEHASSVDYLRQQHGLTAERAIASASESNNRRSARRPVSPCSSASAPA